MFWRLTLPIGMPAIATTIILNLIELWNEFLYAVVLVTDDESAPCRSASCGSWATSSRTSA